MAKYIALLPMKAHSERVPGKNFRDFNGKPLFAWILERLLQIESISKVIINTDAVDKFSEFDICQHEKVIIRQRDEEIIGDFVSMNKVIENDLNFSDGEYFLMTHSTNPLISKEIFERSLKAFEKSLENGYDSIFSCNEYKARFYNGSMEPINHNPAEMIRTQDLDPIYEENSCLYVFSKNSFAKTGARIGQKPKIFITPEWESVDIDNPEDWDKAIVYHKILSKNEI